MSIEAMKLALEALKAHEDIGIKSDKAIASLRAAIEQAEKQEPVAWWTGVHDDEEDYMSERIRKEHAKRGSSTPKDFPIPLYTAPQ